MAKIIVVHGEPGSGKSTQSKRLADLSTPELKIAHISAGESIRAIRTGEVESKYTPNQINHPDMDEDVKHKVVNDIMFEFINREGAETVVLVDGYPRYEGGVLIYVSSSHLLPEARKYEKKHSTLFFLAGVTLSLFIVFTKTL